MNYAYSARDLKCHAMDSGRHSIVDLIARRQVNGAQPKELRFLNAVSATDMHVCCAYLAVKRGELALPNVGEATMAHMETLCEPHVHFHCKGTA